MKVQDLLENRRIACPECFNCDFEITSDLLPDLNSNLTYENSLNSLVDQNTALYLFYSKRIKFNYSEYKLYNENNTFYKLNTSEDKNFNSSFEMRDENGNRINLLKTIYINGSNLSNLSKEKIDDKIFLTTDKLNNPIYEPNDGNINIQDVILSVNIILGSNTYNETADINTDGFIDVLDIINIVNLILN